MTTEPLLKAAPDTPSLTGDGVRVTLSDGNSHELKFTAKALIRAENTWGSHAAFLEALEEIPVGTLASVLIVTDIVKGEEQAVVLLEGVNWRDLREDVQKAWKRANWVPDEDPRPTTGS